MRAMMIHGNELRFETVPDPKILHDRDVIVKMTQCGICGSDLHLVHPDWVAPRPVYGVGHEAIGEVVERGSHVTGLKIGDKVMLAGDVGCGLCRPCLMGEIKRCENGGSDIYGIGWGLEGCQAEAIRVPAADFNAAKIPEGISDDQAILLTDNLVTAYGACIDAEIRAGRSVAVIGLGPIGLMAVELAIVMGASVVFAVDIIAERRERAMQIGAVGFSPEDLTEVIREKTGGKMIDCVIEAVGAAKTIALAMSIVGIGRNVSILGVGVNLEVSVPFMALVNGITVRANMMTEIAKHWPAIIPLLQSGRVHPERFVTHHLSLADGVAAYDRALNREPGLLKVMMRP